MRNLKIDLINNLRNNKYYEELELVRLAQDQNSNYKIKISEITETLKRILVIEGTIELVEKYFLEKEIFVNKENDLEKEQQEKL